MSETPPEPIYSFETFQLDPSRKLLLRLPDRESVALTHKAFQVLLFLIQNSGTLVTKDELMARVWPDSIVEEANLTQTISVLRRALGEKPNQHRFIVTEPGRGYRFVAPVTESNGDHRSSEMSVAELPAAGPAEAPTTPTGPNRRKAYLFVVAVVLGLLLIASLVYLLRRPEGQIPHPNSARDVKAIAVLPFRTVDSREENQLLGVGMADAIITKLSHLKGIVVRQTRSVIRYADATPEAIRVGREINVEAVLEGNIQKADGRIRVSVRMFRVSDGALLWAESFDERDADIFTLQDSISERVANSLSLELNPEERSKLKRRYTENLEAYELYNKGRYFWNNRSSDDLRKSIGFYEQAIAKDPNYSLAYASMAESYVVLQLFTRSQDRDLFPKAKQAAERALSLDDNLAEAHTALALIKEQHEWDWAGAETEFRRAIAANPNYATAHQWYGEFLAFMGRTPEGIVEVEKAVELDPLSLSTNTARAFPYLAARQFDRAIEKTKPALELEEAFPLARYYLGRSYDGVGRHKEAVAEYQKAIATSGRSTFFASAMIFALVKSGQRAEAEKAFAEIQELSQKEPISRYVLARSLAALGKKEQAFAELEKAFQDRDGLLIVVKIDQNLDEIRDDPRYQALLKKMRF